MKYLILSGNPKSDGMCHKIEEAIIKGATDGGAEVERLTFESIARCHICGTGWGPCRNEHRCAFGDDGFDKAQAAVRAADQICIVTPVYWNEMAEQLKAFIDRLRRCEFGQNGALSGKQVLLVASPGGSGGGLLPCLEQMERLCRHTGAIVFDYIGINRWNNDYKAETAYAAAHAMANGRKAGETL